MEDTLSILKKYFADLLIIQYRGSKKNRALIEFLVDLIFANNLALEIKEKTVNVKESVGEQLNIVGKWVGVDRYYYKEIWTHPYLAYPNYSNIKNDDYNEYQGGFSTYSNFEDNNGGFLTYKSWSNIRAKANEIGDEYFRKLIQLKIIKNSINHTCKNIDDAVWEWSEGHVYTTWGQMEITYYYDNSYKDLIELANFKNILLKPTGCNIVLEAIASS